MQVTAKLFKEGNSMGNYGKMKCRQKYYSYHGIISCQYQKGVCEILTKKIDRNPLFGWPGVNIFLPTSRNWIAG